MLWTVFRKEWTDAWRDKRAMRLAWMPVIYFIGMFLLIFFLIVSMQKNDKVAGIANIWVPVYNAEAHPQLKQWMIEQGTNIMSVDKETVTNLAASEHDYVLIFPDDVDEALSQAKPAQVMLVFDASKQNVHQKLNQVRNMVYSFNARESAVNLLARGVSPGTATPVQLTEHNIASDQQMSIYILASVPMILVLAIFIAAIGFSADMTAGERERRSLEALLITPVRSGVLIAGKWLTSALITLMVISVIIILLGMAFRVLPFSHLGVRVDTSIYDWLFILSAFIPLIALATALQILISLFARSFKDAQTYTSLMIFLPTVATFYLMFKPSAFADWFYWAPVIGQHVIVRDTLLGTGVPWTALVKVWVVNILLAVIFLKMAAKKIRSRSVIYG